MMRNQIGGANNKAEFPFNDGKIMAIGTEAGGHYP